MSGLLILVLTLAYGRPKVEVGETHLRAIQALLAPSHLVNLIHYAMVLCGTAICIISVINAAIGCCAQSPNNPTEEMIELQADMSSASGRTQIRDNYIPKSRTNRSKNEKPRNSSLVLCLFIFSLLFLFTLQLIIGLIAFISVTPNSEGKDEFMSSLIENLNATELLETHQTEMESLYGTFKCCGWNQYDDYEIHNKDNAVPDTCCKTVVPNCGQRKHPSNIYYDGCVDRFGPILKEYLLILGSVALGFSIVEVFGLIFSCCLYVQMAASWATYAPLLCTCVTTANVFTCLEFKAFGNNEQKVTFADIQTILHIQQYSHWVVFQLVSHLYVLFDILGGNYIF